MSKIIFLCLSIVLFGTLFLDADLPDKICTIITLIKINGKNRKRCWIQWESKEELDQFDSGFLNIRGKWISLKKSEDPIFNAIVEGDVAKQIDVGQSIELILVGASLQ